MAQYGNSKKAFSGTVFKFILFLNRWIRFAYMHHFGSVVDQEQFCPESDPDSFFLVVPDPDPFLKSWQLRVMEKMY
jgi:hypothetical protein